MTSKALIVWCDALLIRSRSAHALHRRQTTSTSSRTAQRRFAAITTSGWRLLGLAWRPEIEDKTMTSEQARASFARMRELLGVPLEILCCPHGGVCRCAGAGSQLPGLGVDLHPDDTSSIRHSASMSGAGRPDPGFARRLGFQYRDAADFFATSARGRVD